MGLTRKVSLSHSGRIKTSRAHSCNFWGKGGEEEGMLPQHGMSVPENEADTEENRDKTGHRVKDEDIIWATICIMTER